MPARVLFLLLHFAHPGCLGHVPVPALRSVVSAVSPLPALLPSFPSCPGPICSTWQIMVFLSAIAWGTLIVLCIFPPIWTMIPRVETEQGWKIVW